MNQADVGERVRRLRLGGGLSQAELAAASGQASGSISMLENGRLPLTDDMLRSVASALDCAPTYLTSSSAEPLATKPWLRAYADASKRAVDRAVANSATALDAAERLGLERIPDTLPLFVGDANDEEAIELFALEVREAANLDRDDVVPNAMRAAERLGCVLLPMDDELGRHLGLSMRVNTTPVIRVARPSADPEHHVPGDRQRFTVAHEIGHLALHHATPPPDTPAQAARIEKEAHRFAGAFLAPGEALLADLERVGGRVTLSTLSTLKSTWGVAIKALVVRFQQLGVIDNDHARSLYKQISARRWNTKEPVPVGNEQAIWMRKALEKRAGQSPDALARAAHHVGLSSEYFEQWIDWTPTPESPPSATVIAFPRPVAVAR
jgi:Zn-dependent peptidase ImmA (M78 family)/transcriptional regulator with XRE-family HTH domain